MRALKITNSITRRDEKSLDKYLTEISRYDILSPEEELELFKQYKNGDDRAFSRLILHNLRFVVSVAKQYQHVGLWLGDLINEGNIGLIKAAMRFDETKGFKFISYAVWWIRQSILQALNEKSRNIRVPINVNGNASKVRAKMVEILQTEEREATIAELSEATGLSRENITKCLKAYKRCKSLDAPVNDDSDMSLVNMLEDSSVPLPDHRISIRESQIIEIKEMLKKLSPRQATVIAMYYGIGQKESNTLGDIADRIGLSRERVRQIKNKALAKLRTKAMLRQSAVSYN